MNTGNMSNDEADKIANFITGFKLIHKNTPVHQLIIDIRTKDFAVFNEKHCEPYIEMEKQLIIETFKYAQILHSLEDKMRAEQYYYNLISK
jgi:hypothetical protein